MPKYSTAFGMDVHLRSTTVCALDADTGEAVTRRFPGNPWGEIAGWMDGFPGPSLAAYESGYLGFAPQRELAGLGVECVVAAVSKIPRSAADSASKNDRNDAARMAKAILAHDIVSVNLFFTSFAKQAHRSRKGGFTGCANAFSPIPVTA